MDSGLHAQFPTSDPDPGIEAKAEPDPPPPSSCNVESTLGGGVEKACTVQCLSDKKTLDIIRLNVFWIFKWPLIMYAGYIALPVWHFVCCCVSVLISDVYFATLYGDKDEKVERSWKGAINIFSLEIRGLNEERSGLGRRVDSCAVYHKPKVSETFLYQHIATKYFPSTGILFLHQAKSVVDFHPYLGQDVFTILPNWNYPVPRTHIVFQRGLWNNVNCEVATPLPCDTFKGLLSVISQRSFLWSRKLVGRQQLSHRVSLHLKSTPSPSSPKVVWKSFGIPIGWRWGRGASSQTGKKIHDNGFGSSLVNKVGGSEVTVFLTVTCFYHGPTVDGQRWH